MASAGGATDPPGPAVLAAFGLSGPVAPLDGGRGGAFAVGDVVLKRVDDDAESALVQSLATRIRPSGYRLAEPIAADDGGWVHEGWIANQLVEGLRPAAPDWVTILDAGEAFAAEASSASATLDRSALAERTHPWAVADRVAWDERDVALDPGVRALDDHLRSLAVRSPTGSPSGLVHADLAGNVHLDERGVPVVLDLSLYERPVAWGSAVVVVDALLWHGAADALLDDHLARCGGIGLLARAVRFRLVADALLEGSLPGDAVGGYQRLVAVLTDR